jgi:hypothetical protein
MIQHSGHTPRELRLVTLPSTVLDLPTGSLGPSLFLSLVSALSPFSALTLLPLSNSIDIDTFPGSTSQERVAQAAASINADILSPVATSYASNVTDVNMPGFIPFTTKAMVDEAHKLGLKVEPWTPNRLNLIEYLVKEGKSFRRDRQERALAFQQLLTKLSYCIYSQPAWMASSLTSRR